MSEDSTLDEAAGLGSDDASATGAARERAPASEWPQAASVAGGRNDDETVLGDAEQAIEDARRRLAGVPAEVVVTNHVMGLYELAAIHLSATPPNLPSAALAIDAVGSLVDGLGDRLGPDATTLRDALKNIRMAFVSVKSAAARASGESPERSADDPTLADDDAFGPE